MTLAAFEGAGRIFAKATNQERGMTFDSELGWKPLPRVHKVGTIWGATRPASTNSLGWRDQERSLTPAPGIRRAVALGDSFTFGTDVDDGERFTDVLPTLMERLEVINLGVAGYGTDQELRVLETEGLRWQPDVVVLTICLANDLDDIEHSRLYTWPKPYYTLRDGELELRRPSWNLGIGARTSSYLVEVLYQRLANQNDQLRRSKAPTNTSALTLFDALLARIAAVTAQHGARLLAVLAYVPDGFGDDVSELSNKITSSLDRLGVISLDTRALLRARVPDPNHAAYSRVGLHWNSVGHAIVAQGIRERLDAMGLY